MKDETKIIGAGRPHDGRGLVNPAVARGSTLLAPKAAELYRPAGERPLYGRGGLEAQDALRDALCALTGAEYCALAPSGLAGVTLPLIAATSAGGRVLAADCIYGPTRRFLIEGLVRHGVTAEFFDPRIGSGIASMFEGGGVQAVLLESPGSLTFELQDIPAIAEIARANGAVTICDDTWSAGLLMKPLDLGADCAVQALTKYAGGHSDLLAGAALASGPFAERLKETERLYGYHLAPDDAWLALRGLRTLPLRMQRSGESGLTIARWLANRPEIARIIHPALDSHPDHALFQRDFSGAPGLFGAVFGGFDRKRTEAFLDALTLFGLGFSWGGYESLAIHCDPQLKRAYAPAWRSEGALIRFAIGLEDAGDLIGDIERGFGAV